MRKYKSSKLFNLVILLLGLLFSLWISKLVFQKQELQTDSELHNKIIDFEYKIDEELISSVEVMYSITNLFNAVESFTPEVFNNFTKQLIRRKKSILIIEWQPVVPSAERETFIKNAREMGMKDFDLWEIDEKGKVSKAKKRDVHVPVLYAVSSNVTSKTIGLDLSFSPERVNSKWDSVVSGEPRASETFPVIMGSVQKTAPTGFAITIPVFKKRSDQVTPEERRKNIFGFVAVVFDIAQLLAVPLDALTRHNIDFRIVDVNNNKTVIERGSGSPSSISRKIKMDVYGREWELQAFADEKFINRFKDKSEYVLPLVFAFLFLVLYLFLEFNRKKAIELLDTQEKLKAAVNEAETTLHSKSTFLANMSHELRTPLSSMLSYGELLKREENAQKHSYYIDGIVRIGKRLIKVINDVQDVSKLEDSQFKLNPVVFNLKNLIGELDELVVSQFHNPNVIYVKRIDQNVDENLLGDEFRIKQILIILLSNAFKFTDHGQVTLTIEKSFVDANSFNLRFEVSDTGSGISSEFQKHMFDPFTQEGGPLSHMEEGSGLGLSVVFLLVKLMGGRISVNSQLNEGSTFSVTLPFEK